MRQNLIREVAVTIQKLPKGRLLEVGFQIHARCTGTQQGRSKTTRRSADKSREFKVLLQLLHGAGKGEPLDSPSLQDKRFDFYSSGSSGWQVQDRAGAACDGFFISDDRRNIRRREQVLFPPIPQLRPGAPNIEDCLESQLRLIPGGNLAYGR